MNRSNLKFSEELTLPNDGRNARFRAALKAARQGAEAIRLMGSNNSSEVKVFLGKLRHLRGAKVRHDHIVMMNLAWNIGALALMFDYIDEAKKYSSTLQRSLSGFLARRHEWRPENHVHLYHQIIDFKKDVARKARASIVSSTGDLTTGGRQESLPSNGMEKNSNRSDLHLREVWNQVLEAEGVKDELKSGLITKFRLEIARSIRTKWVDRLDHPELRTLTAPAFLKTVHMADVMADGRVSKELIRDIDPDLMKAVEMYVSQRHRRNGGDLGDAVGLIFEGERKPGSGRPKAPRLGTVPK